MKHTIELPYSHIETNPTEQFILDVWHEKSRFMGPDDFTNHVNTWTKLVLEHGIKTGLTDTRAFAFPLGDDLQKFAAQMMQKAIEGGFLKHALLVPQGDLFAEISVEQTTEETQKTIGKWVQRVFSDKNAALAWLKE